MPAFPLCLLALLTGYLLGSIPFGLILTRLTGAGDLRAIGSGNIGATNVLRTGRRDLAAATLLLDAAKGAAAVALVWRWGAQCAWIAGIGAMVGHCFPIWLRLRGGKGVATLLGVAGALAWPIGAICAGVWLAILAATRTSSLGGISAAAAAPFAALLTGHNGFVAPLAIIAVLVVTQHRANIARLRAGTEPQVGRRA